jgi:hypothetical protein
MQLHIITRKVNLNNFADSRYWGPFDKLLELPLNDSQFSKLIEFFQAIASYRTFAINAASKGEGAGFKFFTSPDNLTVGYSIMAVVDLNLLFNVLRNDEAYSDFVLKRDAIFAELGWTLEDEKVFTIDSDIDPITEQWLNLPTTFDEVAEIYDNASVIVAPGV